MNAFQVVTIASTLTVASAGRDSGSSTRQKKPNEPQPSMRAASSSSIGMLRKNGRRMTIESGSPKAACGSATPSRLPDSPTWRMRMYSGRIATAVGKSSPNTNSVYIASRPRNRIRANTNAAADAQPTVTPTATIATRTLLSSSPQNVGAFSPQRTSA